jgi:hypothetical protein
MTQSALAPGGLPVLDREWVMEGVIFSGLRSLDPQANKDQRSADVGFHCTTQ